MPGKIDRDDLLDELRRLADGLDKPPTMAQMREVGEYSERPYKTRFGSWNGALRTAGLSVNKHHDVKETLVCEWCGDEYEKRPSLVEESRFCSAECRDGAKTEWVGENNPHPTAGKRATLTCEWCGREYEVNLYKEDRSRFCSRACVGKNNADVRSGKNSPRWRGGYEGYYGPMWPEQRARALERDGHECTECNATEQLIVHHIRPFREFVDGENRDYEAAHGLDNLRSLCRECHAKIENPNRG